MRESTTSTPHLNRAVKQNTQTYERSPINCTVVLPLLSSLNQLIYLTSTSGNTREAIVKDGGLEQLIHILNSTKVNDIRSGWKWSMAYQCVVNIGVRGNEYIRKRVVEAGIIPIVIHILESFLDALANIKNERDKLFTIPTSNNLLLKMQNQNTNLLTQNSIVEGSPFRFGLPTSALNINSDLNSQYGLQTQPSFQNITNRDVFFMNQDSQNSSPSTLDIISLTNAQQDVIETDCQEIEHPEDLDEEEEEEGDERDSAPPSWLDKVFYREEDILLSLQLLAYLSKYPDLRQVLHSGYDPINVFRLVEQFTLRSNAEQVQHWSGIIMRNACRKDEARGGLRRCAFMSCGKWETYPRQFAKCRRCRKAKYCSKDCQSRAWGEGHKYWCVERSCEAQTVGEVEAANAIVEVENNTHNVQLQTTDSAPTERESISQVVENAEEETHL